MRRTVLSMLLAGIATTMMIGCSSEEKVNQPIVERIPETNDPIAQFRKIQLHEVERITKNGTNFDEEVELTEDERKQIVEWYNASSQLEAHPDPVRRAPSAMVIIYLKDNAKGTIEIILNENNQIAFRSQEHHMSFLGEQKELHHLLEKIATEKKSAL